MKKIFLIATIAIAAGLSSCTKKQFSDAYSNPQTVNETTVEKQFAGFLTANLDYVMYKYWNYFVVLQNTALPWTQAVGMINAPGRYVPGAAAISNRWQNYYAFLAQYKELLLNRVKTYLTKGSAALADFADKEDPVDAKQVFSSIVREQASNAGHCEHLYTDLENYPAVSATDSESFIYWAKQNFGTLKPVINLVHVLIYREGSRIFVASKQIYSSHYTEGALSVAELIPFTDAEGRPHTMVVYSIRLQLDMLGGILGSMKKRMAQPKMLATLKESLSGMRQTMEATASVVGQAKVGR